MSPSTVPLGSPVLGVDEVGAVVVVVVEPPFPPPFAPFEPHAPTG